MNLSVKTKHSFECLSPMKHSESNVFSYDFNKPCMCRISHLNKLSDCRQFHMKLF